MLRFRESATEHCFAFALWLQSPVVGGLVQLKSDELLCDIVHQPLLPLCLSSWQQFRVIRLVASGCVVPAWRRRGLGHRECSEASPCWGAHARNKPLARRFFSTSRPASTLSAGAHMRVTERETTVVWRCSERGRQADSTKSESSTSASSYEAAHGLLHVLLPLLMESVHQLPQHMLKNFVLPIIFLTL